MSIAMGQATVLGSMKALAVVKRNNRTAVWPGKTAQSVTTETSAGQAWVAATDLVLSAVLGCLPHWG